jgi:endo-1,4-beta-mannosidase
MQDPEDDNEMNMNDIEDSMKTSGTWRKMTIWAWRTQKEDSEVSIEDMEEDSPEEKKS